MTTTEEQKMIEAYVKADPYKVFGVFGFDMNEMLRRNTRQTDEQQQVVQDFESLFAEQSEDPMVLYRGTCIQDFSPYCIGTSFMYPAFMSTSRSLGSTFSFLNSVDVGLDKLLLKILVPPKCSYIAPDSINNEQEIILPRNQQFEVMNWEPTFDEQMQIDINFAGIEKRLLKMI